MLKIIKKSPFFPDFSKDLHYISWTPNTNVSTGFIFSSSGYASLSYVYAIVLEEMQMTEKEVVEYFHTIDRLNETGTFYPKKNITIMPNAKVYSDKEIYKHFDDAMKAQNQYIQARNVIFDMSCYSYVNPYTNQNDTEEYLKMIQYSYSFPPINKEKNWFVIIQSELENLPCGYDYASENDYSFLKKTKKR